MSNFAVDIPNPLSEEWDCVGYFDTRDEALAYARETFGADEEGRICLISELPADPLDDDDEVT